MLRLDGTVIEAFHASGVHHRLHVNHAAAVARPRDDGLRVRFGIEVDGQVLHGAQFDVPAHQQAEVMSLFEEAVSRRTRLRP